MAVHRESWTDEKVETLRRMHAAGDPFSMIGFAIGMSRNATIGKARRLGLLRCERSAPRSNKPVMPIKARKAPRAPRAENPRVAAPAAVLPKDPEARRDVFCAIADKANERFAETIAAVTGADNPGVRFLDRGLYQCAMPLPGWDDAPIDAKRVCGRPVRFRPCDSGSEPTSYCSTCTKVVYAPASFKAFKDRSMGARA